MLTSHQARALADTHHVSVTANAGSGKTRVLVDRYLSILLNGRAVVGEIVALTYTEKAASELKRKIAETVARELVLAPDPVVLARLEGIREQLSAAEIGTIHSFCARLLREYPVEADIDAAFTVLEGLDQRLLLQESIKETFLSVLQGGADSRMRDPLFRTVRRLGKARVITTVERMVEKRGLVERLTCAGGLYSRPDQDILAHWKETLAASVASALASPRLMADLRAVLSRATGKESHAASEEFSAFNSSTDLVDRSVAFRGMMSKMLKKDRGLLKSFSGGVEEDTDGAVDRLHDSRDLLIPLIECILSPGTDPRHQMLLEDSRSLLDIARLATQRYDGKKRDAGQLDFEDLQLRAKHLLEHEEIRSHLSGRYRFIMVDEYQDTNQLQYDILLPLLADLTRGNLFIVGDPKQSIYGFRDADVEVFNRTKADILRTAGVQGEVTLEESFRPLRDIVAFVNQLFEGLMMAESAVGSAGVAYERLVRARQNESPGRVEVLLHGDSEAAPGEGEVIARRILAWHGSRYQVFDREERAHNITYRDIAVLLRSRGTLPALEQAFVRNGIPYVVTGGVGYFQTQDIFDFYNYMQFLLNPADDIALAGILRSSFFNVSDAELFQIADTRKTGSLWEHLQTSGIQREPLESVQRAAGMLADDVVAGLRLPVPELIQRILRRTLYQGVIAGSARGAQAAANLEKLQRMARSYEMQGFTNLYDFVRRLKRLIDEEEEEGQGTIDVRGDAVQIMTVHAAKGLEFPVVIVPSLERKFRADPEPYLDETLGIGFTSREEESGPPIALYMKARARAKSIEEEKRVFYVACTRARDMLVLSGSPSTRVKTESWMSWLLESLASGRRVEPDGTEFDAVTRSIRIADDRFEQEEESHRLLVHLIDGATVPSVRIRTTIEEVEEESPSRLIEAVPAQVKGEIFSASKVRTYIECPSRYALKYVLGFPVAMRSSYHSEDEEWHDDKLPAESRGRIVHAVLQHIDLLARAPLSIAEQVRRCVAAEVPFASGGDPEMEADVARAVNGILSSSFWQEVAAGTEARTEFAINTAFGNDFLTGTIDRLYRDREGVWTVLDYKTDRISRESVEARGTLYLPQMKFYAFLLHRLAGAPVVRTALLFTEHPDQPVRCALQKSDLEEFEKNLSSIILNIKNSIFPRANDACSECPFDSAGCRTFFSPQE